MKAHSPRGGPPTDHINPTKKAAKAQRSVYRLFYKLIVREPVYREFELSIVTTTKATLEDKWLQVQKNTYRQDEEVELISREEDRLKYAEGDWVKIVPGTLPRYERGAETLAVVEKITNLDVLILIPYGKEEHRAFSQLDNLVPAFPA
jgi:hypothetical protein